MAVIGITTGASKSIIVHCLAEDLWIDWDMTPMVYINPLIFWTLKDVSKFSIILHGKPTDIKRFSLTTQGDDRIINIKKDGVNKEDCTVIITSDLLTNNEYLTEEVWDEYEGLGEGDKPTLGLAKNISPIFKDNIKSIEWVHTEMEQCAILEISLNEPLKKYAYHGLRIGVLLDFPYSTGKLRRKMLMGVVYRVHYCTFKGISEKDRIIIKEQYLASDENRLAPIVFSIREHGSGSRGLDTSSLAVCTYRGGLFNRVIGKFIELDYSIDGALTSLACSKKPRAFQPFNFAKLDPYWRISIWNQKDFSFALSGPENYHGYDFKLLRPDWDLKGKGHDPITVAVNKFDSSKGFDYAALYLSIASFLYIILDKILLSTYIPNSTTSFILVKIPVVLIVTALVLVLCIKTIFGKETAD